MKRYRAKSVINGEYKFGSVVIFDGRANTAPPYNKHYFYKEPTNTFIAEFKDIEINHTKIKHNTEIM